MVTKTFDQKIGNVYYEKSGDPNIVYQWKRSEVFLSGKENALDNQIKGYDDFIKGIEENPDTPHPTGAVEEAREDKAKAETLLENLKKL